MESFKYWYEIRKLAFFNKTGDCSGENIKWSVSLLKFILNVLDIDTAVIEQE